MKYLVIILIVLSLAWGGQVSASNYDGATRFVYYYVEVPMELSDWESLEELENFLAEDDTDHHRYFTGVALFEGFCVSQAEHLRDEAAKIGRNLEVIPIYPKEYLRVFKTRRKEYHAICMARVDHSFYLVEPDNDVVKRAYKIP